MIEMILLLVFIGTMIVSLILLKWMIDGFGSLIHACFLSLVIALAVTVFVGVILYSFKQGIECEAKGGIYYAEGKNAAPFQNTHRVEPMSMDAACVIPK